jgi:hypothetical protein
MMTMRRALLAALLFAVFGLTSSAATAQDVCTRLVVRLSELDLTQGEPLTTAGGVPFKQLYDECDAHNTFAGHATPRKCSTDPNKVSYLLKFPDSTIVFNAKMAVDADGSPVSQAEQGTDQAETWLTFDQGSDDHYVNAEDVPFIVVPLKLHGADFLKRTGVKKGDLAVAVRNGRCSFGLVGDAGPGFRLGEASLRTHEDLGNPQCAHAGEYPCTKLKGGGSGVGIGSGVTYLVFPGTRPVPLLSQTVVDVSAEAAGERALDFVKTYGQP